MTKLFESNADVCLIPASIAKSAYLSEVLLPVICSQANAEGGTVIIGATRASDDSIILEGLPSVSETQLFIDELIRDRSRISVNSIKAIKKIKEHGKDILKIEVAPAPWTERPVYINSDPVHGVYRYFEGERVILSKSFITMMAKDSVYMQRDNERLEYLAEFCIDYKALERFRELHKIKHPFPKWDLLDIDSYMERIGAKSDGNLLRAGALMFGENENVSFCLRRKNMGVEEKFESSNIWSFTELVLPIFERCDDPKCKNALSEAFFNSLIHADYCFGKVEVIEEDGQIKFINSGIPRSDDKLSICRNLRVMKMLCLVGYAKNKGLGLGTIKDYSEKIRLSANFEKWQTEIVIPVTSITKPQVIKPQVTEQEITEPAKIVEQEKSIIPSVFYPVAKLAKLSKVSEEQDIIDKDVEKIVDYQDITVPDKIEIGMEDYYSQIYEGMLKEEIAFTDVRDKEIERITIETAEDVEEITAQEAETEITIADFIEAKEAAEMATTDEAEEIERIIVSEVTSIIEEIEDEVTEIAVPDFEEAEETEEIITEEVETEITITDLSEVEEIEKFIATEETTEIDEAIETEEVIETEEALEIEKAIEIEEIVVVEEIEDEVTERIVADVEEAEETESIVVEDVEDVEDVLDITIADFIEAEEVDDVLDITIADFMDAEETKGTEEIAIIEEFEDGVTEITDADVEEAVEEITEIIVTNVEEVEEIKEITVTEEIEVEVTEIAVADVKEVVETEEIIVAEEEVTEINVADAKEVVETEEIIVAEEEVTEINVADVKEVVETEEIIVAEEEVTEINVADAEEVVETEEIIVAEEDEEEVTEITVADVEEVEEAEEIIVTEVEEINETEEIIVTEETDEEITEIAATDVEEETEEIIITEESELNKDVSIFDVTDNLGIDYQIDQISAEQQEDSWDYLKDPEQRKILEQILKDYMQKPPIKEIKHHFDPTRSITEYKSDSLFNITSHISEDYTLNDVYGYKKNNVIGSDKKADKSIEKTQEHLMIMKKNKTMEALDFSDTVKMVRENSRASLAMVKDALFEFCSNEFRTIEEISAALLRPESSIKRCISKMIREKTLEENENNAYRSVSVMTGD